MREFATRTVPDGSAAEPKSSFWLWATALVVVTAGIVTTVYTQYLRERNPAITLAVEPQHVDPVTDLPVPTEVPVLERPAPAPEQSSGDPQWPLPALDESDPDLVGRLGELFGMDTVARFLVPERVIRNVVVTIDNLPRARVNIEQRPIAPTPGRFVIAGGEDEPLIAAENYARYAPFVAAVRAADAATIVALYRRFRPLFQEAYEDLGYPSGSFDARLLEVIDHLLGTPEVEGPIRLVQPRVMYEYADPSLEAQSAGRKLLIRMGPDNAALLKQTLRDIRAELARD